MPTLTVCDLMTTTPITIAPNTSLREVLTIMKEDGVRQLPVVDDDGSLLGIITDRDVRLAMNSPLVLHDRRHDEALLDGLTAESCMTPDPITVSPDTPAHRAAQMLSSYKFGALPVVDSANATAGGALVGILTVTDILDHFAAEQRERAGRHQ